MLTRIALALSLLAVPSLAQVSSPEDVRKSLAAQKERAGVVAERGEKPHYTRKFDLSGLPHYVPQKQLTGWIRLHGSNYLADGKLGEYWRDGFARFQPGLRLSFYLPTAAVAFAALYYNQADLAMGHRPGFYDLLAYQRVMGFDPLEITADAHIVQPDGKRDIQADQITDALGRDKYGIAYNRYRGERPNIRRLAVSATDGGPFVEHTLETVQNRSYPLFQEAFFYATVKPGTAMDPNVKEFLRYILSQEGQAEVQRDGKYLPLTAAVVREQLKKLDEAH